jgi:hypothetical protein
MEISLQTYECVHCIEIGAGVTISLRESVLLVLLYASMLVLITVFKFRVILTNSFVFAILVHFKYRVFSAQAKWTLTHTSHKDTEQSAAEASITLDAVALSDSLIR